MTKVYFVTGTDTGVGKTVVTGALIAKANDLGITTAAIKPIAAGCEQLNGQWCNEDALLLQQQVSMELSYEDVNPIALPEPIAPHLAAAKNGIKLSVDETLRACQSVLSKGADVTFIEGAGGWFVPLNDRETIADCVAKASWPVIVVVGLRLGCINHTLLTISAIKNSGLNPVGWVANHIDSEMVFVDANIQTIENWLDCPCIGSIPFLEDLSVSSMKQYINYSL